VGLSGELRPVQGGYDRLKEAAKLGFKRAIIPKANLPKLTIPDIEIIAIRQAHEALAALGL
jgi:DNA repair protein RadA/Sms